MDTKNIIAAISLSAAVIIIYGLFFAPNNQDVKKKKEDKINNSRKKFDLHGHTIDEANQKMNQLILSCYEKGINELLIITGKGSHSKKNNNVYTSEENLKLQASIPEFIKNNSELNSKIKKITQAPQDLGGEGAIIIKLKRSKE